METGTLISLALYFIAMLGIGVYGYFKSTSDLGDYMLGGRRLGPGVTALSAGASDMSGWMLMGLPGAFFVSGFAEVWLALGLLIGAYVNYRLVAPRLRTYTEVAKDSITIPDYFENRFQDKSRVLRLVSAVVIIIFFTLYTASGVYAGGTLFENAFGMNYHTGLIVTAAVVVAYTLLGGFLAVSMTDFVQGCIMFIALIMVPLVGFSVLGGIEPVTAEVREIDPAMLNPFHGITFLGTVSLLAWGLGYFGQPHIIVRFMAIKSVRDFKAARRIGMTWMTVAIIGAMLTGLLGAAYMSINAEDVEVGAYVTDGTLDNAETIFIVLSQILFHPFIGGFLLAAILAAIMSTISSQLLVTSSALTQDFYKSFLNKNASDKIQVAVGRLSVFLVAIVAIAIVWVPQGTILDQVGNAWAGFGSAFGPLIVLSLYWKRMTMQGALAGMLTGAVTVLFWIYVPVLEDGATLSSVLYEMVPGVLLATLAIVVVSRMTNKPTKAVDSEFNDMEDELQTQMDKTS
ncbi:sodium/proline symporter PutP [Aliidiomarina sedimenti]|uniref:Sodium/proline symporter n=1 Tax=Aliidiomarina sedimenti TaxID=1933879 RepID=A0ABY0C263_9GAMM|nr:sodium/proline symporter PutP [Aliidiomarina sedimenti]RUO31947.1 sodium/proline symporter PutP [Aliidiomarina sedimenti]